MGRAHRGGDSAGRRRHGVQLYRNKKLPFFQEKPPIPPHVTALEKLAGIRGLIEDGRHREFVLEVSKILRYYIEDRFELKAPNVSTEEFLYLAERSDRLDPAHRARLEDFLNRCDRVKFALAHMEVPSMTDLYETAESFILETGEQPGDEAAAEEAAT